MKTIYHPTLPGVSREVSEKDADAWKAAGWRFTEPAHFDAGGVLEPGLNRVQNTSGKAEPLKDAKAS